MIQLYFGKDQFRLNSEIKKKTEEHSKKHGAQSVSVLECETTGGNLDSHAQSELTGSSLFTKNKLIILKDYLSKASKETLGFLEHFTSGKTKHHVIFHEREIDKRKKIVKAIKKNGELVEFKPLSPQELKNFTKRKCDQAGITIDHRTLDRFIFASGNDTAKLKSDTEKLIAFAAQSKRITEADLENLIQFPLEDNIFKFTEDLAKNNIASALSFFKSQTEAENNAPYLVFMIARQFRNMIMVKAGEEKNLNEQEVIKKTKMHPYAFQKTKEAARNYNLNQLKAIFRHTLVLDANIKTKGDPQKSFQEFLIQITN